MNCKFCNAELEEGATLCPACGQENAEEILETAEMEEAPQEFTEEELEEAAMAAVEEAPVEEAKPVKVTPLWVKVLAIVGAVALAAVLGVAVFFGIKAGGNTAKSYTVSDEKAVKAMDTVVATVGDLELTNNTLQIYYRQAIEDFYNAYGSYMDASVLDFTKPLDEQYYDQANGITWQQYFLDGSLSTWSRYAALYMQAKEAGFTLNEDTQTMLDTVSTQLEAMAAQGGYESVEAMLQADISAGSDFDGYMEYLNVNVYAAQYLDSVYTSILPTDQEIADYYAQNTESLNQQGIVQDGSITVDARHILICPADTESEESWEECRVKAQEILDKWQAEDGTEEGFAKFAAEYTEDPGSMSTGGLYSGIRVGQMVAPFEDWCFDASRQYGDTGLVKTDYGYHIMFFVASHEIWIDNVRDTIIYERSLAMVNEAAEKWPVDLKKGKIVLGLTAAEKEAYGQ